MKAVVASIGRDRSAGKWIDTVPQSRFLTYFFDNVVFPKLTSWLPNEIEIFPIDLCEEAFQIEYIFGQRLKAGRALEKDRSRSQGSCTFERQFESFSDCFRRLEESRLVGFFLIERAFQTPVSWARRFMRDHLPRLKSEFKIVGNVRPPFFECLYLRRIVKGMLDLDNRQDLYVFGPFGPAKAASADLDILEHYKAWACGTT